MKKQITKKARDFEEYVIKCSYNLKKFDKEIQAVAGARFGKDKSCKTNIPYRKSGEIEKCFDERLKNQLKKIGELGKRPSGRNQYLGNCAEQNACNEILKRNPKIKLKQVKYSLAYRPRTSEVKKYCLNCIEALGVANK